MHEDTFAQIVQLVVVGILGVITYFLKRIINQLDDVEKEVEKLKIRVAIILDRDRQRRLRDYADESSYGEEQS